MALPRIDDFQRGAPPARDDYLPRHRFDDFRSGGHALIPEDLDRGADNGASNQRLAGLSMSELFLSPEDAVDRGLRSQRLLDVRAALPKSARSARRRSTTLGRADRILWEVATPDIGPAPGPETDALRALIPHFTQEDLTRAQGTAAAKMSKVDGRFEGAELPKDVRYNPDMWVQRDVSVFSVKEGVSPSTAILDVLKNPQEYVLDCAHAANIVGVLALQDVLGRKSFDGLLDWLTMAPQSFIPVEHILSSNGTSPPIDEAEIPIGAHCYIENPDVSDEKRKQGWPGENAIKVSDNPTKYYGVTFGDFSLETMVGFLNSARKPNATKSAYIGECDIPSATGVMGDLLDELEAPAPSPK